MSLNASKIVGSIPSDIFFVFAMCHCLKDVTFIIPLIKVNVIFKMKLEVY